MDGAHNTVELNAALSNPRDDIANLMHELEKKPCLNYAANEIGLLWTMHRSKKVEEREAPATSRAGPGDTL